MSDVHLGLRFSQNYLERGLPLKDSPRARRRLYRLFTQLKSSADYASPLETETGAKIPFAHYDYNWEGFFEGNLLRDVLDAITVFYPIMAKAYKSKDWIAGCERIFREENLGYTVDELGGVHFHVDQEFNRNWSSTLACLGLPRYEAARKEFKSAQMALDGHPKRGADAVKHLFSAIETVFRLMLTVKVSRLGAAEVKREFRAAISGQYTGPAKDAVSRQVEAFAEWTTSAHLYRHAPESEVPHDPPDELLALLLSTGAAYLRWLLTLDQQKLGSSAGP